MNRAMRTGRAKRATERSIRAAADAVPVVYTAIDFTFSYDGGTIATLRPNTDGARAWLSEHCPADESHQYLGTSLAIETRYVQGILEGVVNCGLTVERA